MNRALMMSGLAAMVAASGAGKIQSLATYYHQPYFGSRKTAGGKAKRAWKRRRRTGGKR